MVQKKRITTVAKRQNFYLHLPWRSLHARQGFHPHLPRLSLHERQSHEVDQVEQTRTHRHEQRRPKEAGVLARL